MHFGRMGPILKNAAFTALMVVLATVATSALGGMLMLVIGSLPDDLPADPAAAYLGVVLIGLAGALFGVFFSTFTLMLTVLSMPLVLLVTEALKLPRPAMDIIGGGCVGLMCALLAIDMIGSDKFAGMVAGENAQIMAATATLMGCLLGYLRHRLLVASNVAVVRLSFRAHA